MNYLKIAGKMYLVHSNQAIIIFLDLILATLYTPFLKYEDKTLKYEGIQNIHPQQDLPEYIQSYKNVSSAADRLETQGIPSYINNSRDPNEYQKEAYVQHLLQHTTTNPNVTMHQKMNTVYQKLTGQPFPKQNPSRNTPQFIKDLHQKLTKIQAIRTPTLCISNSRLNLDPIIQ